MLRSVCLHAPSDDIHLYVYASVRQGLSSVCFHWRESIYLRSVCHVCLHLPSDDIYLGTSFYVHTKTSQTA